MKKIVPAFLFASLLVISGCGTDTDTETGSLTESTESRQQQPLVSDEMSERDSETNVTLQVLEDAEIGSYLADADGMTLYYFKKDEPNTSNATGDILANWPAFVATEITVPTGFDQADFDVIMREDTGEQQVTYKTYPLYYFVNDEKMGDVTGEGVNDAWYTVNTETMFNE